MAYRFEKESDSDAVKAIVVDGFEKGIADSPIKGIGNIRNIGINYYEGVGYVNYKRKPATIQGVFTFTGSLTTGATFATLTALWSLATGNYTVTFSNGDIRIATFTNNSLTVSWIPAGGLSSNATATISVSLSGSMSSPRYSTQSPAGIIYISDGNGNIFQQSQKDSSIFNVITGCPGTPNFGLKFWENYLFAWSSNSLNVCGDGTGDSGITSANWNTSAGTGGVWPIANASITLSGTPAAGDTGAETISSYVDGRGSTRAFWNGPTGTYIVSFSGISGTFIAQLVQGSDGLSWSPALPSAASSPSMTLTAISPNSRHMSLQSINDGNLYFGNGSNVGMIDLLAFQVFKKENMNGQNFTFNSAVLSLPPTESISALTELSTQMFVSTEFKVYPWDLFSPEPISPFPVPEQISGMINILNDVYLFAGNKGNIYLTNGYNASLFKKIPDNVAGVIDPIWTYGGYMTHRQKLWFQALGQNGQNANNIIAGIFSINLDTKVIVMEAQNSFGLSSSTTNSPGLLIDNNSSGLGYDNYYSAWANGIGGLGGIDFNDTTLWSSNEPTIESDLIPIGTVVRPKTFNSAEFKLDQPLQSGDSISLYARQSLSDTYILLGTTTAAVLSELYQPVGFQEWQWIQFKVTMSCNPVATSSSFNRLREIRIR